MGRKVEILILHASPRKKGVTSILLSEIESNIASKHSVEVVRIYELKMKPCIGCLQCRPDKKCVLAGKVRRADLLIIGSPVYWGNIPGPLKIFFDRNVPLFEYAEAKPLYRIPRPQLKGKKAILAVSSAAPYPCSLLISQSRGTIMALKTILKAGGMKIENVLNVPDSYNFAKKQEKYLQKARSIGNSI